MRRRNLKPSASSHSVEFEIDHIDPLGQGVSRRSGKVTFIAGTLPGESGTAMVYKRAKGVQFARLQTLERTAKNRIEPTCPHFNSCPGCQFLHTDYASELGYKKAALARHLGKLTINEADIEVVAAPRRLAYRNRVQLHYRHKYIGMLDSVSNEVFPIPECKIFRSELKATFDQIYLGNWSQVHTGHGHCELYYKSGKVSLNWNDEYAHGGFSQVFEEMNLELQSRVQEKLQEAGSASLLDLFSGTGNLSEAYAKTGADRVMVDSYLENTSTGKPENFHQMDLNDDQTLPDLMRKLGGRTFDTILIDPPRRGFPDLHRWVSKIKPRQLVYVSCNPASLAWDLQNLAGKFRVERVQLLDLFPSTSHFETLVSIRIPGNSIRK